MIKVPRLFYKTKDKNGVLDGNAPKDVKPKTQVVTTTEGTGNPKDIFKVEQKILTRRITVKKEGVEISALIGESEISILGVKPQPHTFKFQNSRSPQTLTKWKNVLDCMQRAVQEIANLEVKGE
jgi:hypothetical protein